MFGFSLPKLLVLALIIFGVWQGFKYLQRRQAVQDRKRAEQVREARRETEGSADPVEDMVRCSVCDAFVAGVGAKSCGRRDCPYPG
ncbi:MAG: hypothetical protein ACFE0S_01745 [Rhodospirillales bacterium]|mgnify:CR=1 FL=1|jgi:uncharacterized protein